MLIWKNEVSRFHPEFTRRSLLSIGSVALAGLTLPRLLRSEELQGSGSTKKSVIMVYLSGGISHQDTVDLKPNAPGDVRGEFSPIDTVVPGIQICEHLPRLAKVMDRMTVLRSIVGLRDEHTSWQNLTGYPMGIAKRTGRPNVGGMVSKLQGPTNPLTPAAVDLFPTMEHSPYNSGGAGVLGNRYDPVKAEGSQLDVMKLKEIHESRLLGRSELLHALSEKKRTQGLRSFDTYQQQAFDVLTSSQVVQALDVEREDAQTLERYGCGTPKRWGDGAPLWNDQLLMARRLVEAGVRCVTVAYGFWDTHGRNFEKLKTHLPIFDQGIAALVEDLYQRGLDQEVTLLVWGEFGRTPRINKEAGRDHWARVNSALLAGGGMPSGQVIGSTDDHAGEAHDRPIDYRDVLATVYHNLGIDSSLLIRDRSEIPIPILPPTARPIRELV